LHGPFAAQHFLFILHISDIENSKLKFEKRNHQSNFSAIGRQELAFLTS
jgi:hypothetical protein